MRFSIYSELQSWPGKPYDRLYGEVLEQIENADRLGYKPQDNSESYAAEILAREANQPKDPVAERYQGGTFCAQEYDAERMPD